MERVLQFGTGRFLRGFVDAFLDEERRSRGELRDRGPDPCAGDGRRDLRVGSGASIAAQGCRYRLLVRGLDRGRVVEDERVIDVIDRTIDSTGESEAPVEAGVDPETSTIVSNTTEAGIGRDASRRSWRRSWSRARAPASRA